MPAHVMSLHHTVELASKSPGVPRESTNGCNLQSWGLSLSWPELMHSIFSIVAGNLSSKIIVFTTLPPLGGLEPPTFRLTAERASQLRHKGLLLQQNTCKFEMIFVIEIVREMSMWPYKANVHFMS